MFELLLVFLLFMIGPGMIELLSLVMLLVFPQRLLEIIAVYILFFPFLMIFRN
ncbi:putative membrane protein [Cedratvirus kamchatka]|uniref:Membrane protein n=1 Tax=Cedratvirus kamchatka TaxID=2716914 RepID=A0A6G8MXB7_9VIRU|nr:putative membrane protein [Cedratvirus kamchatka]WIL03968.1 putative membrane protein [Cedratvirus lena]